MPTYADSSIYSLIRPQQPMPDPIQEYGQGLQLKNLIRADKDTEAANAAWQQSGGDMTKFSQLLAAGGGGYKTALEAQKAGLDALKTKGELEKNKQETILKALDVSRRQTEYLNDPQSAALMVQAEYNDPILGPVLKGLGPLEKSLANIPQTPDGFSEWKNRRALGIEKHMKSLYGEKGRGEYFVPVQTAEGVKSFDTRRGKINEPSGKPVIGSTSDPALQSRLAGAKEYGQTVGKETADIGRGVDMLTSLKEGRDMLDKGIYSGFYGDIEKTIVKATPGADKGKAANTEQYLSHIGNIVIPRLKDFGGNDTVEELKYLQKVMAGTITIEEKAMRGILDSTERKLKAKMERLSKQAGTVGLGNEAALGLPSGTPVAPAPTVAPVTGGQPNREAIDAELRRRGIIR